MVALTVLLLLLPIFGGLGFAAHMLWIALLVAVGLWLVGFLSSAERMRASADAAGIAGSPHSTRGRT